MENGTGFFRHVLLRRGFYTGQVMVVLVTADEQFPSVTSFVNALVGRHPEITTVVQNFEEMGKITANAVIDKIDKKNGSGISNQLIPVKITIRDSLKKRN